MPYLHALPPTDDVERIELFLPVPKSRWQSKKFSASAKHGQALTPQLSASATRGEMPLLLSLAQAKIIPSQLPYPTQPSDARGSSQIQVERLETRVHDLTSRTHRHASPRLARNERIRTRGAEPTDAVGAGEALLQLGRVAATRAVDLHGLRSLVRDIGPGRRRVEHRRGIGRRRERVRIHDVELASRRVGGIVVGVRDVTAQRRVDGRKGLQVGQSRIWWWRCECAVER